MEYSSYNQPHPYRNSYAIWDYTVLPAWGHFVLNISVGSIFINFIIQGNATWWKPTAWFSTSENQTEQLVKAYWLPDSHANTQKINCTNINSSLKCVLCIHNFDEQCIQDDATIYW